MRHKELAASSDSTNHRQPRTPYPRNQAQRTRRLPPADRAWGHSGRGQDQQVASRLEHRTLGIIGLCRRALYRDVALRLQENTEVCGVKCDLRRSWWCEATHNAETARRSCSRVWHGAIGCEATHIANLFVSRPRHVSVKCSAVPFQKLFISSGSIEDAGLAN